jgi:hypothetical protein
VKKLLVVMSFACLFANPAAAITCEQVRGYVQTYGLKAVMDYVKNNGIPAEEVARGRACLRRDAGRRRMQLGRLADRALQTN